MSSNITVTEDKSNPSLKGTTLYVEEPPAKGGHHTDTGGCITPTAVYIAPNHDKTKNLNIILWFHGHHVKDYQTNIFIIDTKKGKTGLRESVDAAAAARADARDVVLVAPFIGYREDTPFVSPSYDSKGLEAYLVKLCDVLKEYLGTTTVDRLVVAWHSGSGEVAMPASDTLGNSTGTLKDKLKECWGYDCMYNDYTAWMSRHSTQSLYFYHGTGSPASVFMRLYAF
jgi:hypothetical protein